MARKNNLTDVIPRAENILTIAILSIVITAPLGAVGISVGGPKLLTLGDQQSNKKYTNDVNVEQTRDDERV